MSESRSQSIEEWRKKNQVVEIKLRVPLSEKEKIRAYAKSKGKPLATYIKDLIAEDMAKNP